MVYINVIFIKANPECYHYTWNARIVSLYVEYTNAITIISNNSHARMSRISEALTLIRGDGSATHLGEMRIKKKLALTWPLKVKEKEECQINLRKDCGSREKPTGWSSWKMQKPQLEIVRSYEVALCTN